MKPAQLRPLIGRKVACFWRGWRTGTVVKIPRADTVSIKFLPPYGIRQIPLDQVEWVYYYGKRRTVGEYLRKRAGNDKDGYL